MLGITNVFTPKKDFVCFPFGTRLAPLVERAEAQRRPWPCHLAPAGSKVADGLSLMEGCPSPVPPNQNAGVDQSRAPK